TDGNCVIAFRHFVLDPAIKKFVFQKKHRIVVADGGFDQPLRIGWGSRSNNFYSRRVNKVHLRILRVKWASMNASTSGAPQHQRGGSVPAIVRLGHHVDDLVEGAANEVNELKFGHRAEAGERRAIGGAHNGGFSDRSIDHPLRAKVMNKAVSHFERAA